MTVIVLVNLTTTALFFITQFICLNFSSIRTTIKAYDFKEAISRTARDVHQNIYTHRKNYARITNYDSIFTVIRTSDRLLINCTSSRRPNRFNFSVSAKIKRVLLSHLAEVKASVPAPSYTIKDEDQLSFKRVAIRIFFFLFY